MDSSIHRPAIFVVKGVIRMKATSKYTENVSLALKASGADVLESAFKFSKTIGEAVASKEGLTGSEHSERAAQIQRTLRRVRLALENR